MNILSPVLLGVVTGVLSGFFGVGGGVLLVPALVYFYEMTQHQAQGTSLAVLLLPIGLPGVVAYWRAGNVNVSVAMYVVIGFLVGILASSSVANQIPADTLRRGFGILLFLVSLKMVFFTS